MLLSLMNGWKTKLEQMSAADDTIKEFKQLFGVDALSMQVLSEKNRGNWKLITMVIREMFDQKC